MKNINGSIKLPTAIGGAKVLNNDTANWQLWIADAGITYQPY